LLVLNQKIRNALSNNPRNHRKDGAKKYLTQMSKLVFSKKEVANVPQIVDTVEKSRLCRR
ncbi:hypothetical protein Anas_12383, partial [Armadillidium nasatum]